MGFQTFTKDKKEDPKPVEIKVPEQQGTSGQRYVEPKIVVVQIPVGENKRVDVDSFWKKKYEEATQRQKDSLYSEAIRVRTYKDTLLNDDKIIITGDARTRGSLLDFKVDYKIKERTLSYTPKVVYRRPTLSAGIGVSAGVPTQLPNNFTMKGDIYFENRKGNGFSVGYDTNKTIWVGLRKTFKLKK